MVFMYNLEQLYNEETKWNISEIYYQSCSILSNLKIKKLKSKGIDDNEIYER